MGRRKPENEVTPPPGGVRFEHQGTSIYVYPDGRVWSVTNARFNTMSTKKEGYKYFRLGSLSGSPKDFYLHDVVLTLFGPPKPPGAVARHKDGDPSHNWIDNLEWGTQAENIEDQYRHGTAPILRGTHNRAKLKPDDVRAILHESQTAGTPGPELRTSLASRYGVTVKTIDNVISGRTWGRLREAA